MFWADFDVSAALHLNFGLRYMSELMVCVEREVPANMKLCSGLMYTSSLIFWVDLGVPATFRWEDTHLDSRFGQMSK